MSKNPRKTTKPSVPRTSGKAGLTGTVPWPWLAAIAIAFLAGALYLPALKNEFLVNWDEDIYILDNPHIRSLNLDFFRWAILDYKTNLWHPVTWVSHAIDYAIWGLKPYGHHLTNILLHGVNTGVVVLLTYRLILIADRKITEPDAPPHESARSALIASGIAGLLFGIHPQHVESVVWITERKDLLYALFYLLSMTAYIRYATTNPSGGINRTVLLSRPYQASLLLFLLSLASKPMAVTLPVILLLLDWYPLHRLERKRNILPLLTEKLPFFLLSGLVSLLTIAAQQDVGGMKSATEAPPLFRLLLAMKSLALYAVDLVAPFNLLPLHPYPKETTFTIDYAVAAFCVVGITAVCIKLRDKRLFLAVWLFFVISLLPVLGFLQAGVQARADRFVYLAAVAPFLLTGLGCSHLWSKTAPMRHQLLLTRGSILVIAIICTVSLSWLTSRQIAIWKNAVVLWSFLIEKDKGRNSDLYVYRASALERSEQQDKALDDYARALVINPKNEWAYFNRGTHYLHRNIFDRAIEDFSMVIKLNPNDADAYSNRGNAYLRKGNAALAIKDLTVAIDKKPRIFTFYVNRGNAFSATGQLDNAINDFTKALAINPDLPNILVARGALNMRNGRFEQGMQDFKTACDKGFQEGCRKAMFPF